MNEEIPDGKQWEIQAQSLFDESWEQWGETEFIKENAIYTLEIRKRIHFARTFRLVEITISSKVVEG